MSSQELYRPVLVVGAGPIGMTAALALRNRGLPATVLEAEPENRLRPGSRAIYLHNATLQHLENISPGLGFTLAKHGVVWQVKRTLFRGKEVYVRRYEVPDPNKLPPFTSIHQREAERYMYRACLDAGVEFIWGTPVTDVK
ncbi:MAG: FAD-dependent monooxygenase, partial [Alicyclobacillaceae bacterium]|nr:FAD-dependent monooxygenase [Alicyclobacillaceae bacterium]